MRRALVGLVVGAVTATMAVSAMAQEEGGSPPIVVVPVPTTQPTPTENSTPVAPRQPADSIEQPFPPAPTEPNRVVTPVRPWFVIILALVAVAGVGLVLGQNERICGLVTGRRRADGNTVAQEGRGKQGRVASTLGSYELLAITEDDGGGDPVVITRGRFVKVEDAVEAVTEARSRLLDSGETPEHWWVVRSCQNGVTILVIGPGGEIGLPGKSWSRLERALLEFGRTAE
jgi:hypothetical protein